MNKKDAFFTILFILTDPEHLKTHSDLSAEQIKKLQTEGREKMGIAENTRTFKTVPNEEIKKHLKKWKEREALKKLSMN